jgi:hypothetical protein
MAAKKASTSASRAKSRVASRAKGQARAAASKTSAKQDRAAAGRAYSKPGKVTGAGSGPLPVAAARLAAEALKRAAAGQRRSSTKPRPSTDPMRNKKAPKKTNDQMFDEYYRNWSQRPPRR